MNMFNDWTIVTVEVPEFDAQPMEMFEPELVSE
jgi:hypothetical protein